MSSKTRSNNLGAKGQQMSFWSLFICSQILSFPFFIDNESKERKLYVMRKWHKPDLGHWYTTVHPVRVCAPPSRPRLWLNIAVCYWSGWKLQSLISIAWAVKCFEMQSLLITYVGSWCITCPRTSISINISDLYGSKREHCWSSVWTWPRFLLIYSP